MTAVVVAPGSLPVRDIKCPRYALQIHQDDSIHVADKSKFSSACKAGDPGMNVISLPAKKNASHRIHSAKQLCAAKRKNKSRKASWSMTP